MLQKSIPETTNTSDKEDKPDLFENSPLKTIYIIRHGQTDFNKKGIVQGSGVDTDLNEKGRLQSQSFFETYRHIPFQKICVSSLKRTRQTVDSFANLGITLEEIPELNEINWGEMEGVEPTPESHQKFIETIQHWAHGQLDIAVAGGETPLELFERQKRGLRKIEQFTENPILICMHGRAMRSFLCLLTGTPLQNMDTFEHGNVCLYVLEKQPHSQYYSIITRNCRIHLHKHILD